MTRGSGAVVPGLARLRERARHLELESAALRADLVRAAGTLLRPRDRPGSEIIERSRTMVNLKDRAMRADGRVGGCCLHGLLENARPADTVEAAWEMERREAIAWGG